MQMDDESRRAEFPWPHAQKQGRIFPRRRMKIKSLLRPYAGLHQRRETQTPRRLRFRPARPRPHTRTHAGLEAGSLPRPGGKGARSGICAGGCRPCS